jgi:flagellar basal-body rod modification protein FlgD
MQIDTSIQSSSVSSTTNNNTVATNKSTLDMNDFFKLMTAQLQNQDMFNPVDDTQFMAQMAQYSTLQQMQDMSKTFDSSYAVSLLGKNVLVNSTDENGITQQITGSVDKIDFQDGTAQLYVNGNVYATNDITSVLSNSSSV